MTLAKDVICTTFALSVVAGMVISQAFFMVVAVIYIAIMLVQS